MQIPSSDGITDVLATQSDWRAMAGLLAFLLITTMAAWALDRRGNRADLRRKDGEIERMNGLLLNKLTASTEATSSVANALHAQTLALSRIEGRLPYGQE